MIEDRQKALMNLETIVAIARVLSDEISKNMETTVSLKEIVDARETLQNVAKRINLI